MPRKPSELLSSRPLIEEFMNSTVWKDIVRELKSLRHKSLIEYDIVGEPHKNDDGDMIIPTTAETLIHLGDIKGRRKAVDYFLSIPDIFLQILDTEKEEREFEKSQKEEEEDGN